MSLSLNTPASLPAPGRSARAEAPRPQYLELKANVHRKLLNRLNLEALASAERPRAEAEIRTLLFDLIAEEGTPLSMSEREVILGDVIDEVFGLGPLEPLLRDPGVSDILVNTYQHVYVERSRQAGTAADDLPGRQAPDARHRPHRQRRRTPRRRQLTDGRRATAGRLACQRHHSAAGGRRSAAVDSPFPGRAPQGGRPGGDSLDDPADARVPGAQRPLEAEHADQRRNRRRKDDAAQRALELHLRARTHRHDRRRGRVAAPPGARGAPRDPSAERRRQRRDQAATAAGQRPAYAARPHRRRRNARRRSARHVAGDEHRSRRFTDHGPRQQPARRAVPYRNDDRDGRDQPAGARDAAADRRGDSDRHPAVAPERRHA